MENPEAPGTTNGIPQGMPDGAGIGISRSVLVLFSLFLYLGTAAEAATVNWIPGDKIFCCDGRVPGVFDLTGTWEGISRHNPPFGTFTQPGGLLQKTGPLTRPLWSINLVDQEVGELQLNGGQEVIQTYTGTYLELWLGRTNPTGQCLPFATFDCVNVRRRATYDVTFSIRWCKGVEGFAFWGLEATDMRLVDWNSEVTMTNKIVINAREDAVCPGVTSVVNSPVTFDYEGAMIIAGFSPGGETDFAPGAPLPYDEVEYLAGDRDDCGCERGGRTRFTNEFGRKIGPAGISGLKSTLSFTVTSDLPLDLVNLPFQPMGEFRLLKQTGDVREKGASETEFEYREYLKGIEKTHFQFINSTLTFDDGVFTFSDVPLFDVIRINGRDVVRPARYSLRLSGLNVEEYVTGSNPLVSQFTKFSGADAFNLQAGEQPNLIVTPLDGIPIKRSLIDELSLMSPTRYLAIENLALAHLNNIDNGSPTPEQLEGLDRAILAERVVRDGGNLAREQIALMLKGMSTQLGFVVDELYSIIGTGKALKEKKDRLSNLESALDPQALTEKGWENVPTETAPIRSAMNELISENFDLQVSIVMKEIKIWIGFGLKKLKSALITAGLSNQGADEVSQIISVTINTIMDALIEQGPGASKSIAKKALEIAILSAQDEAFDTLPFAYTDWTDEALCFSQQRFESWNVENDAAFRTDRSRAEYELVQLGIDAYATLGRTQALQDITQGLSDADGVLDSLKVIPVAKKAKLIAKLGKFVTGGLSYLLPLKGAFYDMPIRVEEGVARSYGLTPASIQCEGKTAARAAPKAAPKGAGIGTTVIERFKDALISLEIELDAVSSAWSTNDLTTLLAMVEGDEQADLLPQLRQVALDLQDVVAMSTAARNPSSTTMQMQSAFTAASITLDEKISDFLAENLELLTTVLTDQYTGPEDATYLVAKANVLDVINRLKLTSQGLRTATDLLRDAVQFLEFDSPVLASEITIVSQATGESVVTQGNEPFVISATLRNLGDTAVSQVEAELLMPDDAPISITGNAIQIPGSGTLGANDADPMRGADEVAVTWNVTYIGAVDDEIRVPLTVRTRSLANDDPGLYFDGFGLLGVSAEVFDPDADAMPTAWEVANGLQPNIDDGDGDADGDLLTNAQEFERETDPQDQDTDNDGLDDGEEVLGTGGWITDPINDDTDGDEILDGADGSPLDPTTDQVSTPPEPSVLLSTNQVVLNAANPQATIFVTNGGEGVLLWQAESSNPSLVLAGNGGEIQAGNLLFLQYPQAVDPEMVNGETVQVVVSDAIGANKDSHTVTVTFGQSDLIFADGFE